MEKSTWNFFMRFLETDHGMKDMADSSSADNSAVPPGKRPTPRVPAEDPPGRLSGNCSQHNLWNMVAGDREINLSREALYRVCSAFKKRNETRHICLFYAMPRHKGSCFVKLSHVETIRPFLNWKCQVASWCISYSTGMWVETSLL